MRHLILACSLLVTKAIAADCDETNIHIGPYPKNCDNIFINNTYTVPHGLSSPIILTLSPTGVVDIGADIILDGQDGSNLTAPASGGLGGPGAGAGGGINIFGDPEDGQPGSISNGKSAPNDVTCANGGGGGGLDGPGSDGSVCDLNASTNGIFGLGGADALSNNLFAFDGISFRGGFGGGAGGQSVSANSGAGGGGGGALYINAGSSDILIREGVTIFARGGNGGDATLDGGGGGGGSGGAIWLQTTGAIHRQGTINVSAGIGGKNPATIAHGGDGASGRYMLEDSSGTSEGSGILNPILPPPESPLPEASPGKTDFTSSISCGSVYHQNTSASMITLFLGFILAGCGYGSAKILFQNLKKLLKNSAGLH